MQPNEVFLSHSNLDQPFVNSIIELLRGHGVPVWHSTTNIIPAQQWHDEIGSALGQCDWLVVVLSPNSVSSKWVKRELLFALDDDRYEDRIIPLLYQPCDYRRLSWTIPFFQMVDFTGDFDMGCRDLLRVWGLGHKK